MAMYMSNHMSIRMSVHTIVPADRRTIFQDAFRAPQERCGLHMVLCAHTCTYACMHTCTHACMSPGIFTCLPRYSVEVERKTLETPKKKLRKRRK